MRILVDMNLTPRWVDHLRDAGHQVDHWASVGSATAKDREICDFARAGGYVVVTNDLDFPQILAHTREAGPSIVLLRGEPLVPEVRGAALLKALTEFEQDLSRGAIVSIDLSGPPRARLLPMG
jgi:predicted nuclease of predicted toxin-antitoxin system